LWAPYHAGLKAVAAERDKKLANLDNIYLLNLDKMKKERAEAVDLDGALAVKAEMDRLEAHQATSEEQRKAMPPALRALRASYDAALKSYLEEAASGDGAALQKYLVDLEGLQKRITMTGDLQKALMVKAERDRLTAGASNPQPAPIMPEVKVAPVPAQPVVGSTMTNFGSGRIADATKERPFENTLGMKFVLVPITGGSSSGQRVLFSIWETRVQDYEAFVKEKNVAWPKPNYPQDSTHPAVNVSWDDAQAFCNWLTGHERKASRLGTTERYRLPTDHEWSCAVGIGDREDPAKTPEEKHNGIANVFQCGSGPQPRGLGNYKGVESEEAKGQKPQPRYRRDEFPNTAPVGSFAADRFGLFDLGGNAWEWCEDLFSPNQQMRFVRGGSFTTSDKNRLLTSHRFASVPGARGDRGFRVVVSAVGLVR